jgi:hypothetical protein
MNMMYPVGDFPSTGSFSPVAWYSRSNDTSFQVPTSGAWSAAKHGLAATDNHANNVNQVNFNTAISFQATHFTVPAGQAPTKAAV